MSSNRMWSRACFAGLIVALAVGLAGGTALAGKSYGAPIDLKKGKVVQIDEVFANTEEYLGKNIIVEGPVATVCQTSGCWLTLDGGANQLYVQFFDFTVRLSPKTKVQVQGELRKKSGTPYLVGQGLMVL